MISSKSRGAVAPAARRIRCGATAAARYAVVPHSTKYQAWRGEIDAAGNTRQFSTSNSRQQLVGCRQANVRRTIGQRSRARPHTSTRPKSSWGPSRLTTSLSRYRLHSSWHRPGCKWVRSEGDPRSAPRDTDCPACQAEEQASHEMSRRELMWERHLDDMKRFICRDPYDFLFGRSNERLRALWGDHWKWARLDEHHPVWPGWSSLSSWRSKVESGAVGTGSDKATETTSKPEIKTEGESTTESGSTTATKQAGATTAVEDELAKTHDESQPIIRGSGSWSVSAVADGKHFQASGELEYDPITMRMVPKEDTAGVKTAKAPSTPATPIKDEGVEIPVKKPPEADGNKAASSASQEWGTKRKRDEAQRMMMTAIEKRRSLTPISMQHHSLKTTQVLDLKSNTIKKRLALLTMQTKLAELHGQNLRSGSVVKPGAETSADENVKSAAKEREDVMYQAKRCLERSWARENESKSQQESPKVVNKESTAAKVSDSPHFSHREIKSANKKAEAEVSRIVKREVPLKYMTAHQIGLHRAALLRLLEKKQQARSKKAETAAERRLNEEIRTQKLAMTAFENRWHHRLTGATGSGKKNIQSTTAAPAKALPVTTNEVAEGDLCPRSVTYAASERWYKKKAPHALAAEEQRLHDRNLVRSIRDIYEGAYGEIGSSHEKGNLQQSFRGPWQVCEPALAQSDLAQIVTPQEVATSTPEQNVTASLSAPIGGAQDILKEELADSPREEVQAATGAKPDVSETVVKESPPAVEQPPSLQIHDQFKSDPDLYQVLAYDPSTHSIYTAKASSSFTPPTGEKILPFSDALVRLQAPAKFLPHLAKHQSQGYDIVSANRHLLVLKKVRPASDLEASQATQTGESETPPATSGNAARASTLVNPVDGTGRTVVKPPTPATGNFASPTGFVNHDVVTDQAGSSPVRGSASTPSPSNPRVKREEPVFSGLSKQRTSVPPISSAPEASSGAAGGNGGDGTHIGASTANMNNNSGNSSPHFGRAAMHQANRHHRRRAGRFRRGLRRMFFVGTWVAACCYATGAIIESLRGGGNSGGGNGGGGGSSGGDNTLVAGASNASSAVSSSADESSGAKGGRRAGGDSGAASKQQLRDQRRNESLAWQVAALAAELTMVMLAGLLLRAVGLWLLG